MELFLIIVFYILGNINTFTFKVQKYKREYCFSKEITLENQRITFNYATVGETKEYVDVTLKQIIPNKKDLYLGSKSESDNFKTNPLNPGKYNLCFYPYSTNLFSIVFNFQSSEEDGDYKNVATDSQLKEINKKVEDIKKGMKTIETNADNIINRKFSQFLYLTDYINQIKKIAFAKAFIIGLMSILQIYIIKKMFGDDKRMSQIKANQKQNTGNKIEFL